MINTYISALAQYVVDRGLIEENERIYSINMLLDVLKLDEYNPCDDEDKVIALSSDLEAILQFIDDYACDRGLIEENSVVYRDLFDTRVMNCFVRRPSEVIRIFNEKYAVSPKEATDFYYEYSKNSDYIRTYRIAKDIKWVYESEYGDIDITINMSKPEKDPKAIAAARNAKQSSYPKCLLCVENEGYAGRINHPARENHRIIPIRILGKEWGFQYSPYVYYNEHCIVLNREHTPMTINREVFEKEVVFKGFEDVEAGILKWPMSVIRIRSTSQERFVDLADKILGAWREFTDEEAFIFAKTNGEPHNTITPAARFANGKYELDLALRNNITTEERPLGVYHPRNEYHHIKKENIGGIEVMGLAILPSRIKSEMELLARCIIEGKDIRSFDELLEHADWAEEFIPKYEGKINKENVDEILKAEIGKVFVKVLEDAGVFKRDKKGREYFMKFIESV